MCTCIYRSQTWGVTNHPIACSAKLNLIPAISRAVYMCMYMLVPSYIALRTRMYVCVCVCECLCVKGRCLCVCVCVCVCVCPSMSVCIVNIPHVYMVAPQFWQQALSQTGHSLQPSKHTHTCVSFVHRVEKPTARARTHAMDTVTAVQCSTGYMYMYMYIHVYMYVYYTRCVCVRVYEYECEGQCS